MNVSGVALVIAGNDLDTDRMYPGRYLNLEDPDEMALHLFEGFDSSLREAIGKSTVLVVGENFGMGSSREHVPLAMRARGVRGLIGHSFARIFWRNCINLGLPIVTSPEAVARVRNGSQLVIDSSGLVEVDGVMVNIAPLPALVVEIVAAGGLIPWTAARTHGDGFRGAGVLS